MMKLRFPFEGPTDVVILEKIKNDIVDLGAMQTKHTMQCFDLLGKLTVKKPKTRISAHQACFHEWFELKNKNHFLR